MHPVSSYYFQKFKSLYFAGNFNADIRPDLLFFSIWGVICQKTCIKRVYFSRMKQLKLCVHHQGDILMNIIYSTEISVVLVALTEKEKKYWIPLVCYLKYVLQSPLKMSLNWWKFKSTFDKPWCLLMTSFPGETNYESVVIFRQTYVDLTVLNTRYVLHLFFFFFWYKKIYIAIF